MERLLTVKEVATWFGVPVQSIYAMRHRGTGPPAVRVGARHLRFRETDVEAWLEAAGDERPRSARSRSRV